METYCALSVFGFNFSSFCFWGVGEFDQILSRKSHLDDEIYNQLVQKAKDEEYDVSKLHKTPQSDPPPEEEGPKDTKGIWWFKSILGM